MTRYFELEKTTSESYDTIAIQDLQLITEMKHIITGFEVNNGHVTFVEIDSI